MKPLIACCLFILLIVCSTRPAAQSSGYAYNKEKIYLQANHVFFTPGSQIFFKLYLVNGIDNKPSKISNVVYVEVLGPSGAVAEKQTYHITNGYCEGYWTIQQGAVGGLYRLKAYTSWMQNEKESNFFVRGFTVQKILAPRILMKLDFPRKGYGAGDQVTADFSMRNLDNQPIRDHEGKFMVSLNGKVAETTAFTTGADGKAKLSFVLPQDIQTTDGLLNVTVTYDAFTECISRSIPITLNKIDLQFMPEGGSFVAGIATNIAFRAVNEYGKPVDVSGNVLDSRQNVVASFGSYKFGMGQFLFTPLSGETYHAKITSPKNIKEVYALPMVAPAGVVMNMSKANDTIAVKLTTTNDITIKLVGQTKSVNYYVKNVVLKKGANTVLLNEKTFPAGIAQFTLFGPNNMPLAERLMFLNENKKLHVEITTNKQTYLPREKVVVNITTKDEDGMAVPSNLSLAVVDDKLWTMADDKQDNIFSWLLMSSELKGKIEEPQFYFKKDEPKASAALNLVMLTHGYRYFDFIEYVAQNGELKYTPDEGNIVSGIITNEKDTPVVAEVFLVNNETGGQAQKLQTADDGVFYFSGLIEKGNYILLAQALGKKEKLRIKILQNGLGYNPLKSADIKKLFISNELGGILKPKAKEELQPQAQAITVNVGLADKVSSLDEIVVTGYTAYKKKDLTGAVAIIGNYGRNELNTTPVNTTAQVLNGKVAGLEITQNANPGASAEVKIRGASAIGRSNEPLIVVDGVPLDGYNLNSLDVSNIEYITVFKDATAIAAYGARAANGVIAIQSKWLRNEKLRFKLSKSHYYTLQAFTLNTPGYTFVRRFYMPEYSTTVTDERNDFRETIYWNPVIQTDKQGNAVVEFYNSDATTTFRAIAEGIGYNGELGRTETTYSAQSAMSVDVKIPPYLTVGDKALIPLTIKNNRQQQLHIAVDLTLPANMRAGAFDSSVIIGPDSSKRLLVPVEATAATAGDIRFSITNGLSSETIAIPVTATGKGFPVIETFSGNRTAMHNFMINKAMPGSLHTRLNLYKDVEGRLVDGIAAMLREPHGCFEQTSSTTYPNVFILKYLRQSGKSNPAIEKKAMGYLEEGYKMLIGYETPENGFEWFGHAPAHEALTAYGLLEFTDMKEFIHVDQAMLDRAKNLLLKRRDAHGGFNIMQHGYDEFREVSAKIANAYIVYALSQAGYGADFVPEYHAAVKKAIERGDAYQLAIMALAANNMKNENDYRLLMNMLKDSYTRNKLASETSIVNSRDASLRVESMALYALALMRDTMPDVAAVAELMSKILNERSYYGYGSTQATVLALQAVVEYAKLAGEEEKNKEVMFKVNENNVFANDSMAAAFHEGENSFAVDYSKGAGIPYNLEVAYNTFIPPNSDKASLQLTTAINNIKPKIGETVRMDIEVKNNNNMMQPMAIAKIGIPAGLIMQPWQLRELIDKNQVAYYEIFDNYLVLYWMGFEANETKKVSLDLKADIPGTYKAKASNVYLYYTPEYKNWNEGIEVEIGY